MSKSRVSDLPNQSSNDPRYDPDDMGDEVMGDGILNVQDGKNK